MSVTVNALSLVARLTNAGLTLIAGVYVLYRYNRSRLRQSLYWGLGLISLGIAFIFTVGFAFGVIGQTVPSYFIEETFLSLSITLFYYACATALTKSRVYSTFLTWIILILQEVVIVYFYLILDEHAINLFIHVIFFGLPVSTLVAVFFTLDYLSLRRKASLFIAIPFWFQLVLAPILLIVNQTPFDWIYYVMNAAIVIVYFTGFVMLAHSKRQQE
jgi:hypothetical protein